MQRSPTGKPEGAESGVRLRQLLPGGRPAVKQAGRGTVGSPRDVGPHFVGPGPAQFGLEAACGHNCRVVAAGEGEQVDDVESQLGIPGISERRAGRWLGFGYLRQVQSVVGV